METQTWLSRHYKFISAENITILSILSDEFLHTEVIWQDGEFSNILRWYKFIMTT